MHTVRTSAGPVLILLLLLFGAGCGKAVPEPPSEAEIIAEIEAYRQARLAELREPDSWLTLAGLYWLQEGENTFGSDAANVVVFPAGAPGRLGTFTLAGGRVRLQAAPGSTILHDGVPVDTLTLTSDAGAAPTILEHGSLRWYAIDREGRIGIRLKDRDHPARAAFDGIDAYPIDLGWRRTGRFEPYDPPRKLPILNVAGMVTEQTSPGAVAFDLRGTTYRLDVTGVPGDSSFFVIFADATNRTATYEGGRYLWVDAPDEAGAVVIDFNRAYNPPCVFTPFATCPLPPPQNRLPIPIEAGEKKLLAAVH